MWLSRLLPYLARAAAFVYYRIRYAGEQVPRRGPVLLVANHQNSLIDPVLVAAAAKRPLRFLAKAPLFEDVKIAWLVKSSGALPVYRRADDPAQMARNLDTFRAAHDALAQGAAVGIFPEGLSHSEPSLAPLKTGAARIALGGAQLLGHAFPIVPVGLTFREKDVFRSEAMVLVGEPAFWDDLAPAGPNDTEAVRELTERIAARLRTVTVNLARWHDQPLLDCALAVWEAEGGLVSEPAEYVTRLETTTRILSAVRAGDDSEATELAGLVESHGRRLARLGLRPGDVRADVRLSRGLSWAARRVPLVLPFAAALGLAGFLAFWLPYRLTGWAVDRLDRPADQRATYKLLFGTAIYGLWVLAAAALAAATLHVLAGVGVLVILPAVGMGGLVVRERWRGAWTDARRFLLLRSRRKLRDALRERQQALATRLDAMYRSFLTRGVA